MSNSPKLSVVMSVYNGQEYLAESIESILSQSYTDFEFIIINDGSTDATGKIIESYSEKDNRITYFQQHNIGLTKSLNKGIKKAKGQYIARQDADDVSLPERFRSQLKYLTRHPDVVLCGTWFREVNENRGSMIRRYPLDNATLKKHLRYVNYFCHPSVIFLKKAFTEAGGYDENFTTAQDFELWIRLAQTGRLANIPEVLVEKKIGFSQAISWKNRSEKSEVLKKVISKHFHSLNEINIFMFLRHYLPLFIYSAVPVPVLKLIRRLRYRS